MTDTPPPLREVLAGWAADARLNQSFAYGPEAWLDRFVTTVLASAEFVALQERERDAQRVVAQQVGQIAVLTEDVAQCKERNGNAIVGLIEERRALQQRVAALEAALRNAHDPHDEGCASWPSYDRPCDCGVRALLAPEPAPNTGGTNG